jgi:hypothetical protein
MRLDDALGRIARLEAASIAFLGGRFVQPHPRFNIDIAEKPPRPLIRSAHAARLLKSDGIMIKP